jgi:hypothetical protein
VVSDFRVMADQRELFGQVASIIEAKMENSPTIAWLPH